MEIWCMGILKNEFESRTYEFLEIWCMGFLKNECGIFGVFGKFWYENFFLKMNPKFLETWVWEFLKINPGFLETWVWEFKKINPEFLELSKTWVWEFFKLNPGFFEVSETLIREFLKKWTRNFSKFRKLWYENF